MSMARTTVALPAEASPKVTGSIEAMEEPSYPPFSNELSPPTTTSPFPSMTNRWRVSTFPTSCAAWSWMTTA
jgi:hypothetical protein